MRRRRLVLATLALVIPLIVIVGLEVTLADHFKFLQQDQTWRNKHPEPRFNLVNTP